MEVNIEVYVYPTDSMAFSNNMERQQWETTTVIRSALYQFVKKNGYMPKDLHILNQPFPNNYLSELPKDPYTLKNNATTSPNGDGGWLFSPVEIAFDSDLISAVKEALKPNIPFDNNISFMPLFISIDKENHLLAVMSGNRIMRRYSVAVGENDTTPEGTLNISKKVMNPDKIVPISDNVYGTRAMELSNLNYAVHGTNTPSSIGKDVSQGCIRLNNSDMEDLYSIIPLNTSVRIFKNLTTLKGFTNPDISNKGLFTQSNNSKEEDNSKLYHWGG
ncbi:MAG: L,D-transpeptidase [Desulfosporosinus sp.]|nr:L,D-transpeptidase [Desulfosporosinus sp.]